MLRRMILGGLVALALAGAAASAYAEVSVNIGINLPAPPQLVVVPGTPVFYAPAVYANYFFYRGQYYVFANDFWYVGPRHNGPWVIVAPEVVPRPILAVPVAYYRVPPAHWKHWRRAGPPQWEPRWGQRWEERREGREGRREGREERRDDRRDDRRDQHRENRRDERR